MSSASSISGLGGSVGDLLSALRQRLLGGVQPGGTAGAIGQADSDGDSDGSGSSSLASALMSGGSSPVTGSGVSQFDPRLLMLFMQLQEQQAAGVGTGTGPSQSAATLTPRAQQLFNKIDANGDGQISQSELEAAFTSVGGTTAQADALFAKLDSNGDNSVSTTELAAAYPKGGHHHMHMAGLGGLGLGDLFGSGTAGDTTTTVTNGDGSTTTTIAFADGTKIDITTPGDPAKVGTDTVAGGTAPTGDPTSTSDTTSSTSGTGGTSNNQSPSSAEALIKMLIKLEYAMIQDQNPATTNVTA